MEGIVYHGSSKGDIDVLTAHKSTHQKNCIYATSNKAIALLFMGKGHGDLDTRISFNDGCLELVERREGVLSSLYNKDGYLYILDGESFAHYDYLWSGEVISFANELEPLEKIHIQNILEAIGEAESENLLKVYRYPDRPANMPLDNSDLIDKYMRFESDGHKGAVADLLAIYPEFEEEVAKRIREKSSENGQKKI